MGAVKPVAAGFPYLTLTFFHQLMHVVHKQDPTTWQTVANKGFVSKCCKDLLFQLWTHDCGGFPQITLQLAWIGARHVWLWRLPWRAFTAGLYLWSDGASVVLSFYPFSHSSSIYAEICLPSPKNNLRAGCSTPPFSHFLDLSQRLIISWKKTSSQQTLKVSTKCGNLWTQNGQISCRATIWGLTHSLPSTSLLLSR